MTDEPDDFEALVRRCMVEITMQATNFGTWHKIADCRQAPAMQVRRTWFGARSVKVNAQDTLKCPALVRSSYDFLVRCRSRVARLMLAPGDALPGQVDAALRQVCEHAEATALYPAPAFAGRSSEADAAAMLAAKVGALVILAEQREQILHEIDDESLAAQAAALSAGNAEVRALLNGHQNPDPEK